ncbi:MAG: hypothetical protein U0176_13975 [Bacteroidia bacterium]
MKLGSDTNVGVERGRRMATGGGIWEASRQNTWIRQEGCDNANIPDMGSDYEMFYGGAQV